MPCIDLLKITASEFYFVGRVLVAKSGISVNYRVQCEHSKGMHPRLMTASKELTKADCFLAVFLPSTHFYMGIGENKQECKCDSN